MDTTNPLTRRRRPHELDMLSSFKDSELGAAKWLERCRKSALEMKNFSLSKIQTFERAVWLDALRRSALDPVPQAPFPSLLCFFFARPYAKDKLGQNFDIPRSGRVNLIYPC